MQIEIVFIKEIAMLQCVTRIPARTVLLTACLVVPLVANAQWIEPAGDVVSTTDKVVVNSTLQLVPRVTLTGQEFHQAGITSTDGLSLLLGVNRANNRQLWIVDSTQLSPNSTNAALRFLVGAGTAHISGIATDGVTPKNVVINPGGGDVGIGTTSVVGAKLAVVDNRFAISTPLSVSKQSVLTWNTGDTDFGSYLRTHENIAAGIANSGGVVGTHSETYNTGAGTAANVHGLRLYAGVQPGAAGVVTNAYGSRIFVQSGNGTVTNGYGLYLEDVAGTAKSFGIYQVATGDRNYFAGHVNVGGEAPAQYASKKLYVLGDAYFDGTLEGDYIKAHYQDVAEWVPATEDMPPGTVVVLNRASVNQVKPSATAYDTSVAGVVSAQPGLILGVAGADKEQIATTGRVRVRVDATAAPIAVGDLLVTSDRAGVAMRSEPMEINGRPFHQPGTIVGKALEPLNGGVGEILVLLSLQ